MHHVSHFTRLKSIVSGSKSVPDQLSVLSAFSERQLGKNLNEFEAHYDFRIQLLCPGLCKNLFKRPFVYRNGLSNFKLFKVSYHPPAIIGKKDKKPMKLTEIPIELRAEILSKLSTRPLISSNAPKRCTLESSTWYSDTFPDDMLHCAKASAKLSEAVIRAFGSHVRILNFHRSRRISEWIPVLGNYIKAVSLCGLPVLDELLTDNDSEERRKVRHGHIVATLKALCNTGVALEALNLEGLGATDPSRAEEVAKHVIKAIQRSSLSLKEIAFHINLASAMAIPHLELPNLQVAQVSSDDEYGEGYFEVSHILSPAKVFGVILQGLDGHANRSSNISTVRELRLYNLQKAPSVQNGCCSGLFHAVRKLIIMCSNNSESSEIASFVANFRNLNNLHWFTGFVSPEDMDAIFGGCPDLQKLSLSPSKRNLLPGEVDLADNTSRLRDLFISFRRKQKKLELGAFLSFQQIQVLGEFSPNLQVLEMYIDADNVGALSALLGTHSRRMRELRLLYSRDATDCLDREGWSALSQGICSASDELCVLSFVGDRTGPMIERAANAMVAAINKILEFMGDRASCIVFRVPINTHNPFTVLDAISQTLSAAKIHCRFIETLCLDFIQHYSVARYRIENNADEDRLMDSVSSVTALQRSFSPPERHSKVDVGDIDALWEFEEGEVAAEEGDLEQALENWPA